jgi:outer membrane protein
MSELRALRALGALGALVVTSALAAQEPRVITFDQAVRIALAQNATLRQAANAASLDAVAVQQAKMQFLPDLRLSAQTAQNYGRSFSETEGRTLNETTQSLSTGMSSSVVLFDGFANVATLREAQLTQDAGELDLRRAGQTVVFTVTSNYLALVQQREQLLVRQQTLAQEEALERQIAAFVDAGRRTIADLYQQQAVVASARLAAVEAARAAELAEVDVMQTLQLDPSGNYEFVAPDLGRAVVDSTQGDLDALVSRALAQRMDVDADEARQTAAEQAIRAAKASLWPAVSLSAGYNTGFSSANELGFSDQLDQSRGGSVSIGVSIPLFDRGATILAAQRAQIQADNARISLDVQQQEVGMQVRRAYLDFNAAREQLRAAEAQQRAAALALEASQERYRVGAATLVELTQSRTAHVQAESALVSARYNVLFQRMLLDYYVGELNPETVSLG